MRWQRKVEIANSPDTSHTLIKGNHQAETDTTPSEHQRQRAIDNDDEADRLPFSSEIDYATNYDPLTGLPNQSIFFDRTKQVVARGQRYNQLAAVLMVDVGMLSQVNTALGRLAGDKLLVEIANRLHTTFRKHDGVTRITVSRFTGNEFAILLNDLNCKEMVIWLVKRLQDNLAEPIDIDGNSLYLTSQVGISLYPSDANSVDELINAAISAKKYCKQQHIETHYQFFDQYLQELSVKHLNLDKELRQAIENEEWQLYLQPRFDLHSKNIVGAEALIRWQHPSKGILLASDFMEFAEQRGLVVAINEWLLKAACQQLRVWAQLGFVEGIISINVSAAQIRKNDFVAKILEMLDDEGVSPHQLELEITETTLMSNLKSAQPSLKALCSQGVHLAVYNFSTGYTSLKDLNHLPINTLKINQAFIEEIVSNNNDKQLINGLITLAHSMKMSVVAVSIDNQATIELLSESGCDQVQSAILSPSLSTQELKLLLEENTPHIKLAEL